MNKTIFGKMITDYSGLEDFSLVSCTGSEIDYNTIYKNLRHARKAGIDFSADIQMSRITSTGQSYVRQTLIFMKTDEVKWLRDHLHGNMRVDYCSSAAYKLPPACIFRLAVIFIRSTIQASRQFLLSDRISRIIIIDARRRRIRSEHYLIFHGRPTIMIFSIFPVTACAITKVRGIILMFTRSIRSAMRLSRILKISFPSST